jgi:hypothetical protein
VIDRRYGRIRYTTLLNTAPNTRAPSFKLDPPITALKIEGAEGTGVGVGLGAALQGSRPSYTEPARGFSSTKLPPKPLLDAAT